MHREGRRTIFFIEFRSCTFSAIWAVRVDQPVSQVDNITPTNHRSQLWGSLAGGLKISKYFPETSQTPGNVTDPRKRHRPLETSETPANVTDPCKRHRPLQTSQTRGDLEMLSEEWKFLKLICWYNMALYTVFILLIYSIEKMWLTFGTVWVFDAATGLGFLVS